MAKRERVNSRVWECVHGEVSAPREEQPASRLANISLREAALNVLRAARRSSADMKTTRTINGHLHYRFICQLLVMLQECQIHLVQSQDSESISLDSHFSRKCQVLNSFIGTFLEKQKPDWCKCNCCALKRKSEHLSKILKGTGYTYTILYIWVRRTPQFHCLKLTCFNHNNI